MAQQQLECSSFLEMQDKWHLSHYEKRRERPLLDAKLVISWVIQATKMVIVNFLNTVKPLKSEPK